MAAEFANRNAPPMPWTIRMAMIQSAPAVPMNGVKASRIEPIVKIRKPPVYILTRPYRSPSQPKATTRTAVTRR